MKIYNHSHFSDGALATLLDAAASAVGCDAQDVVVVARASHQWFLATSGCHHGITSVGCYFVEKHPDIIHANLAHRIPCNGCIELKLPKIKGRTVTEGRGIEVAQEVYSLCCHEFSHARDFHERAWTDTEMARATHKKWRDRPWERRATQVARACLTPEKLTPARMAALLDIAAEVKEHPRVKV